MLENIGGMLAQAWGDVVEPIAVAMLAAQYIGLFLVVGLVLLGSLLLPWGFLRKARMVGGVAAMLIAVGIFAWTMYIYPVMGA